MLACEHLPGGGSVVVMEHLGEGWQTLDSMLRSMPSDDQRYQLSQALLSMQNTLHSLRLPTSETAADRVLVHGDMRPPNIMVQQGGFAVKLIDWDWAGVAGKSRYPLRPLNPAVKWPAEVKPGAIMQQQHDKELLQRCKLFSGHEAA
eukprot:GHUV01030468.1.p1 GENE.GHUV01030468.1~~GHUV01030468.1.p1  ORF type:complete len:155 (-),score=34.21 GHUV01030468.1:700-1140(-)